MKLTFQKQNLSALAIFQVLNSRMWLVAAILGSTGLASFCQGRRLVEQSCPRLTELELDPPDYWRVLPVG